MWLVLSWSIALAHMILCPRLTTLHRLLNTLLSTLWTFWNFGTTITLAPTHNVLCNIVWTNVVPTNCTWAYEKLSHSHLRTHHWTCHHGRMAIVELWKDDCVIAHLPFPWCIHDDIIIKKTNMGVGYIQVVDVFLEAKGCTWSPKGCELNHEHEKVRKREFGGTTVQSKVNIAIE